MEEKQILALMDEFSMSSITEMDLSAGDLHLVLRKSPVSKKLTDSLSQGEIDDFLDNVSNVPQVKPVPSQKPVQLAAAEHAPAGSALQGDAITAPIVATFYAAANPDTPPFVSVGSRVKKGDTLCILEAMKTMNHLEAEYPCEILQIHAKSGDFVEFGQPLFTVKKL
jgi:acetyl-CoA carboxylase biotin carboxyl carrier protein